MKNKVIKDREVILMVGLPGSGKSTYVNDVLMLNGKKYTICSTDDIIKAKAIEMNIGYEDCFKISSMNQTERLFKEKIWAAIDARENIIIDRTNLTLKGRAKMLSYFDQRKAFDYNRIAVLFDVTDLVKLKERCAQREASTGKIISIKVFDDMVLRYVEPTLDEFDEIIKI